jgi:hypothetical protein
MSSFHDSIDTLPVGTRVRYDVPDELEDTYGTVVAAPEPTLEVFVRWDDNGEVEDVSFDTLFPADPRDGDAQHATTAVLAAHYPDDEHPGALDNDIAAGNIDGDSIAELILGATKAGRATGGHPTDGDDIAALRTVLTKFDIPATPDGLDTKVTDGHLDGPTVRQMLDAAFNAGRRGDI